MARVMEDSAQNIPALISRMKKDDAADSQEGHVRGPEVDATLAARKQMVSQAQVDAVRARLSAEEGARCSDQTINQSARHRLQHRPGPACPPTTKQACCWQLIKGPHKKPIQHARAVQAILHVHGAPAMFSMRSHAMNTSVQPSLQGLKWPAVIYDIEAKKGQAWHEACCTRASHPSQAVKRLQETAGVAARANDVERRELQRVHYGPALALHAPRRLRPLRAPPCCTAACSWRRTGRWRTTGGTWWPPSSRCALAERAHVCGGSVVWIYLWRAEGTPVPHVCLTLSLSTPCSEELPQMLKRLQCMLPYL